MNKAKELVERLKPLHAERTSREKRGVPVPAALTLAIRNIETELASEYNRHEHEENIPETEFMATRQPYSNAWMWYIAGALVCLAAAAWVGLLV